jgi:glycogen(starch) synthase
LRILLVTEDLPAPRTGGLARHVLTIARLLADRGHQVDIAHRMDSGELTEPVPGRAIACLDLRHTGWKEPRLGVFMYARRTFIARRFARALKGVASGYDVLHYHGHLPILANYLPDSVNFAQTIHDYGGVCPILVRLRRHGVCTTTSPQDCVECVAGDRTPNLVRRIITSSGTTAWRADVRRALERAKTVFVSRHVSAVFQRYLGALSNMRTWAIPNLVNPQSIRSAVESLRDTKPIAANGFLFMAGAVYAAKGFAQFLNLFCNDSRFDSWEVFLAGDGPDLPTLKSRFGDRVRWLGWLEHQHQLRMMAQATAVVMPSVWEEPCPTVLLEGLALGKPVYALGIGTIVEPWLRNVGTGRLVTADSLPAIVDKLAEHGYVPVPLVDEDGLQVVSAFSHGVVTRLEQVYAA